MNCDKNWTTKLPVSILSVSALLSDNTLAIPSYQRPYKWTTKHVNQLFADIRLFSSLLGQKSDAAYRLGTVVFHKEMNKEKGATVRNIVDGQQRTITLLLVARALLQEKAVDKIKDKTKREGIAKKLADITLDPEFTSEISTTNIHVNYGEIVRLVSRADFTEEHIDFLLNKCQVVTVELEDISEAFQFFDSQNARGRDLEPHDLLKAYHLREFSEADAPLMAGTVAAWENSDQECMAKLFAQYLYRIRNWSRGQSARYFGKDDIGLFKGVNIDKVGHYPYVEQLRIAHHFVDQYNQQYEHQIDRQPMVFPFHLDQIILNGRRFFEMTNHYQAKVEQVRAKSENGMEQVKLPGLAGKAVEIMAAINVYEGMHRTGDGYVREMFDCLLIYYIDKFGEAELSRAIEKIFIWAYRLRLEKYAVQMASMDNYVLENNLFTDLKEATQPADFLGVTLPGVKYADIETDKHKVEKIILLFKNMNFLEKANDTNKGEQSNGQ